MPQPQFSIVIPAYNEEVRLRDSLDRIKSYFDARKAEYEVVVVDDGSTDNTAQMAAESGTDGSPVRLLQNESNRGKGFSVCRGMIASRGRLALLTDADLSTPIEEIEKLERHVENGRYQIAIGSRDMPGSQVEVHQSRVRESSGKFFNLLVRLFFDIPFRDTQCGFKLFDMEVCRPIFEQVQVERYSFDVEVLLTARRMGLEIKEVPVIWRHHSASKVHFLRDGSRMILDLFSLWRKNRRLIRRAANGEQRADS